MHVPRCFRTQSRNVEVSQQLRVCVNWGSSNKCTGRHTWTNTLFSSICAVFIPQHFHFPWPKTSSMLSSICFLSPADLFSHLSGRKTFASGPHKVEFRVKATIFEPKFVPWGIKYPHNVSPRGGTVRNNRDVAGGNIRRPSRIIACKYGSWRASASVVGFEIWLDLSSTSSALYISGFVTIYSMVARKVLPVVSEPASLEVNWI